MQPPEFPVGPFIHGQTVNPEQRAELIRHIESLPSQLRELMAGITEQRFRERYRNWTVCQIAHHLADSHMNGFIRFKGPRRNNFYNFDWVEVTALCAFIYIASLHCRSRAMR